MQQNLSCPVCGNSVAPGQVFCGSCGAKFGGLVQQQTAVCPACGSQAKPDQQFCGTCGTTLSSVSQQQQWIAQQMPAPQVATGAAPGSTAPQPPTKRVEPAVQTRPLSEKKYGLLSFAIALLQIMGWIIIFGGCIGAILLAGSSIGVAAFAQISVLGSSGAMIIKLIGGVILSIAWGFGLLAFAEICKVLLNIERNTRYKENRE